MTKLYYSPGACSLAGHILLEELGRPYELKLTPVGDEGTGSEEFLKINPRGRVPVLIDGAEIITESPAILFYLSSSFSDGTFWPKSVLEQARCWEWFNWLSSNVHAVAYGQVWRPGRFIDDERQWNNVISKGKNNLHEFSDVIENNISGKTWCVGESYSCVDPYLFVFYSWGKAIGLDMESSFPAWSRHAARMLERLAVQNALRQEGLIP
ncbi:glutathione S-transferase family protein [Acetobacter peroxydans]|uniref:glutathione S-transferase family protein n=1 Tax=Acetobacter peroxydans TaxID=104098 RepID=UPI001144AFEE|nr:glutathione S-transferase N-terminal domain-containing protein [Acetobacter peroxydans]NHO17057.1 glutathione S-transferase [Acetobacter peroxydans]